MRYADDFVMGFERVADARRMMADLKERLARFRLALHEGKTRLIEFGRLPVLPAVRIRAYPAALSGQIAEYSV